MTKNDLIEKLKLEHPTLKIGSDENGYIELSAEQYESTIEQWAESIIAKEKAKAEAAAKRSAALAKLEALGLNEDDLKALGL